MPAYNEDPANEPPMTLDEIANALCRLALRLGSADNITVIVVVFVWSS